MSSTALMEWLAQEKAHMIALLEHIVNIDSGSYDHEGVDRVGDALKSHLEERGIPTEIIRRPNAGFCLTAKVDPTTDGASASPVLLMGHRDTVFSKGEAARRPFRVEGDKAYGPGVADMKASKNIYIRNY